MKNKGQKILITSLTLATAASVVGSVIGSLAWYQYSTTKLSRSVFTIGSATSNLQFKDADGFWVSRLDFDEIDALAKKNYRYAANGSFSEVNYGTALSPVTSNSMDKEAPLKGLYENPKFGWTKNVKASTEHYLQFNLEVRNRETASVFEDGQLTGKTEDKMVASDVKLTDLTISDIQDGDDDTNDVSDAIRIQLSAGKELDGLRGVYLFNDTEEDIGTLTLDGAGHATVENQGEVTPAVYVPEEREECLSDSVTLFVGSVSYTVNLKSDNLNRTHTYVAEKDKDTTAEAVTYSYRTPLLPNGEIDDLANKGFGGLTLLANGYASFEGGMFKAEQADKQVTLTNGVHSYVLSLVDTDGDDMPDAFDYVSDKDVQDDTDTTNTTNWLFAKGTTYTKTHGYLDLNADGVIDSKSGYDFETSGADNLVYGEGYQTSFLENDSTLLAHEQEDGQLSDAKALTTTSANHSKLITVTLWLEGWQDAKVTPVDYSGEYTGDNGTLKLAPDGTGSLADAPIVYQSLDDGTFVLGSLTERHTFSLDKETMTYVLSDAPTITDLSDTTIGNATWDGKGFAPLTNQDEGYAVFNDEFVYYHAAFEGTGDDRKWTKILLEPNDKDIIYRVASQDGETVVDRSSQIVDVSSNSMWDGVKYNNTKFAVSLSFGVNRLANDLN